jgi:Glutathione S-transferase, C-terminal domain
MKVTDPIVLKYFTLPHGLGGRGGAQRFVLLANGIPFTDELVAMDYWFAEGKAKALESGENPCGTLPVVFVGENKEWSLSQHIASSRYLAHLHGVTKDMTAYDEYVQDLVADEYMGFRDAWAHAAFDGTEDEKKKFKEEAIPKYLTKFDKLYNKFKTDEVYLSKTSEGSPLWGDAALFGLLRDNVITGFIDLATVEKSYTNLWNLYETFGKIEPVKEWLDKH